jgi:NADH:ubiquinone oxidoreductase subunit 6 (subunit J)
MRPNLLRALAILALALLFIGTILSVDWPEGAIDSTSNEDLGGLLFGEDGSGFVDPGYSLIVVLIGLLLLVALLGGVFLAKEEKE